MSSVQFSRFAKVLVPVMRKIENTVQIPVKNKSGKFLLISTVHLPVFVQIFFTVQQKYVWDENLS